MFCDCQEQIAISEVLLSASILDCVRNIKSYYESVPADTPSAQLVSLDEFCWWKNSPGSDAYLNKAFEFEKAAKSSYHQKKFKQQLKIKTFRFEEKLQTLLYYLDAINDIDQVVIKGRSKVNNRINKSVKCTAYIGVVKNGPNWQALVTISGKKTYVGTYLTPAEAAQAYDCYHMLEKSSKAKTNFDYTKQQVVELLCKFRSRIED